MDRMMETARVLVMVVRMAAAMDQMWKFAEAQAMASATVHAKIRCKIGMILAMAPAKVPATVLLLEAASALVMTSSELLRSTRHLNLRRFLRRLCDNSFVRLLQWVG